MPTLLGGYPSAFASLLIKQQRTEFLDGLNKRGLDKQGYPLSTRDWLTSFVPGSTTFVTDVVKVHGFMAASEARDSGMLALRITVNYLFTYAIEPPRAPADWMRAIGHEQGYIDFGQWNDPGGALEPFFQGSTAVAGALCNTTDGYDHPAFPQGPPSTVRPSGTPVNPYSLATTAPGGPYRCRASTGT